MILLFAGDGTLNATVEPVCLACTTGVGAAAHGSATFQASALSIVAGLEGLADGIHCHVAIPLTTV